MNERTLSVALADSISDEVISCTGDIIEVGLDTIMNDGILKDVPILSTVISLYKIGDSIRERCNLKKIAVFVNELNKGIVSDRKKKEYREKFITNDKFRNQQIEYLLVLIDRYIGYDKPRLLAKLYLAYLDGIIVWEELTMYAEVVDRFLLLDYNTLKSPVEKWIVYRNIGGESILRLVALGLMCEITETSSWIERENGHFSVTSESLTKLTSQEKIYKLTEFGEKLVNILR